MTDVYPWDEVEVTADWSTLLFGNGFSRNVWSAFAYDELLRRADIEPAELRDVFAEFQSSNFEHILAALSTTQRTLDALGEDSDKLHMLHESLRTALFTAVQRVHPAHAAVQVSFEGIATALAAYHRVFTTNYDLLPYWAVMDVGLTQRIKDAFWSADTSFDRFDAESGQTLLFYLHGALHLYEDDEGIAHKLTSSTGRLLNRIATRADQIPLFVSEGSVDDKRRAIRRSEYLSHALAALHADEAPTVVFGFAFGENDRHILTALKAGKPRPIAVSVFHDSLSEDDCAELEGRLYPHQTYFFDAETHPLGVPGLNCG